MLRGRLFTGILVFFFFKQKTAYEIGLGIPAEPLFRSFSLLLLQLLRHLFYRHLKLHRQRYIDRKSGSAGMPRPISYAVFCLKKKKDVAKLAPGPPSFLWLVDITDETRPVPFATFQFDG